MRAIDGPGAVSNRFVDYDAVTNPNGTVYTADYGNDIQDEIIAIQDEANLTEAAGTNKQLLKAMRIVVPGISYNVNEWVDTTTYSTVGTLVRIDALCFAATGKTGNLDKDPTVPANSEYWVAAPGVYSVLKNAMSGTPLNSGAHPIHDVDNALYQQYFKMFTSIENSVEYDYYYVHLDGTALSGALLTLMTGYQYLDQWAPDDGGTRYLKNLIAKFDTGYFTPADWTNASTLITHDMGVPVEELSVKAWSKSDDFGVQSEPLGMQDYTSHGSVIRANNDNSSYLTFTSGGIFQIDPALGTHVVITTLTNPEVRVVFTNPMALFGAVDGINSVPGIIVKKAV